MGLAILILGLIVLLGAHVFVTFRGAREQRSRGSDRTAIGGFSQLLPWPAWC